MHTWITSCPDPLGWLARIEAQSRAVDGCVVWTGRLDRKGYGVFKTNGRQTGSHRAAWLAQRGPVEPGLVIDHLCRNRACVNVEHMEPVTTAENIRRGETGRHGTETGLTSRSKTECVHGHPFDEANTRWATRKDGYVIRLCRACGRDRLARYKARKAQKAPTATPVG